MVKILPEPDLPKRIARKNSRKSLTFLQNFKILQDQFNIMCINPESHVLNFMFPHVIQS